jgi:excisionase family DNA binding protein
MSLKQLRTLTISEASERLNLARDVLRRWCIEGKVRHFQAGRKCTYHIVEADLVRHIEQIAQGGHLATDDTGDSSAAHPSVGSAVATGSATLARPRADISDLMPPIGERRFARAR